jgi:hypothetical protein
VCVIVAPLRSAVSERHDEISLEVFAGNTAKFSDIGTRYSHLRPVVTQIYSETHVFIQLINIDISADISHDHVLYDTRNFGLCGNLAAVPPRLPDIRREYSDTRNYNDYSDYSDYSDDKKLIKFGIIHLVDWLPRASNAPAVRGGG